MPEDVSYADEARKLVNDERFQGADPQQKITAFLEFTRSHRPQLDDLPEEDQRIFAIDAIQKLTVAPESFGSRALSALKEGAGAVAQGAGAVARGASAITEPAGLATKVAESLPAVGRIAGGAIAPRVTEQLTGTQDPFLGHAGEPVPQARPTTRALAAITGALISPDAEHAPEVTNKLLENKYTNLALAAAADATQFAAEMFLGTKAVRMLGIGATMAGKGVIPLFTKDVTSTVAEGAARTAARAARVTEFQRRLVEGATAGTIATVFQGIEQQETPPLSNFVTNPIAFAAFGVTLLGARRFLERFPRTKPEVLDGAAQLMRQDPSLKDAIGGAQQFVNRFAKATDLRPPEAADLAFRAAREPLEGAEQMTFRRAIVEDPQLLGTEFGEHTLRMQRAAFEPRLSTVESGPLRVTVEDAARRTSTRVISTTADRQDLISELRAKRLALVEAEGPDNDVNALKQFAPGAPPLPKVADFENVAPGVPAGIGVRGSAPGAPEPPRPTLADAALKETFADAVPRQTYDDLRDVDLAPSLAPAVAGRGPVPESTAPGEIVGNLSAEAKRLDEVRASRPAPGSRIETPEGPATVTKVDDPVGVTIERADGSVKGVPSRADGAPEPSAITLGDTPSPEALEAAKGRLSEEARQRVRARAQEASDGVQAGKRALARDKNGRFVRVTPDPATGSAIAVDTTTGEAARLSLDQAAQLVLAGNEQAISLLPDDDLVRLARTLVIGSRSPALSESQRRLWSERVQPLWDEFLLRRGSDRPADISDLEKLRKFILDDQRGSFIVGGPRNPRPLPRGDYLSILGDTYDAKVLKGDDGFTVRWKIGERTAEQIYPDAAAVERALLAQAERTSETARITRIADEAARNDSIRPRPEPLTLADAGLSPEPVLRAVRSIPPVDSIDRYVGAGVGRISSAFIRTVTGTLSKIGAGGRLLADRMIQKYKIVDQIVGRDTAVVERVTDDLKRAAGPRAEEILTSGFYDFIEKGKSSGNEDLDRAMRDAYDRVIPLFNRHYDTLRGQGVETAPLQPSYLPHVFDVAQLRDPNLTAALVAKLKKSGRVETDEEALDLLERSGFGTSRDRWVRRYAEKYNVPRERAEALLDQFVRRNADRRSAHLEFDRIGIDGYLKDIRLALPTAIQRNARRIAEVHTYGVRDAEVEKLIARIRDEGGEASADFAREVFAFETGVKRTDLNRVARFVYNLNTLKLSMSVIANTQQIVNTMLVTNMRATAKALGWTARDLFTDRRGFETARAAGSITQDILADIGAHTPVMLDMGELRKQLGAVPAADLSEPGHVALQLLGRAENTLTWLEHATLALFNMTENKLRIVSTKAGEFYFDDLVRDAERGGLNPRLSHRFKELELDGERVLDAAKRGDAGTLSAMRTLASLSVSDISQFKSRLPTMPLWRESGLGRFTYQFKTFSWSQSKLVLDELGYLGARPGKPADPGRAMRTLAILATVYPGVGMLGALARGAPFAAVGAMTGTDTPLPVTSRAVMDALRDPTAAHLLGAYAAGLAFSGGLGIIGDMALNAFQASRFGLDTLLISPSASLIGDALSVGGNLAKFATGGDPVELKRAIKTGSRVFGGAGVLSTFGLATRGSAPQGRGGARGGARGR